MTARDDYPTLARVDARDDTTLAAHELRHALDELDYLRIITGIDLGDEPAPQ